MNRASPSSQLVTSTGDLVQVGGIYYVKFLEPIPGQPPVLPHVGPHVGVVIRIRQDKPFVSFIYGTSRSGPGRSHHVDPKTDEGYRFEPWIRHRTFFRDDTCGALHQSWLGDQINTCLPYPTLSKLQEIEESALCAGTVFDLRNPSSGPAAPPSKGDEPA